MPIDRRSFLQRAAAMIPAIHAAPLLAMPPHHDTPDPAKRQARFALLRMRTAVALETMADFYRDVLRLPCVVADETLTVTAGDTAIEFVHVDHREGVTDPYYHFAFNIPHNQLDSARSWIEPRCPLVKLGGAGGGDVVAHFQSWDAHAIYFLDPAGNILEFIARHTLKNDRAGEFSEKNILCASEIGVVAPEVVKAADQLCEATQLERYHGGSEQFTAVGDELGLFIVVKTGRRWFSSDRAAEVFEAEATLHDAAKSLQSLHLEPSDFTVDRET